MGNEVVTNATSIELDKLVNDKDWTIRREVAIRGRDKDLDILVYDKELMVRKAVARHGRDKDLNLLVRDNDHEVRYEVAKKGRDKDLDILVYDEYAIVRKEVAKHGRDKDLEILKSDKATTVRKEALKQLENKSKKENNVEVTVKVQEFDVVNSNNSVYPQPESIPELKPVEIITPEVKITDVTTQIPLSVQEPNSKETNVSVEDEYEAFTFEDIDNIVDGQKEIEPETIKEDISEVSENNTSEAVEVTEDSVNNKVSFKTKVSNFLGKFIKKGN